MDRRFLSLVASVALSIGASTMAQAAVDPAVDQAAAPSVGASAVGRWLYNPQGKAIGSVRRLSADGQTAVIMVGSYTQPGSHEAKVPTSALSRVNGKVTLRTGTIEAPNTQSR